MLRKAKNIYYPPAIRAPSLSSSKIDAPPKVAGPEQHSLGKVPSPPGNPPEMDEQPKPDEKGAEMTKDVTLDNTVPSAAPQEHSKDKEDTRMEIFLASLPILAKGDSKGAYQGPSPRKKKKKDLGQLFFFFLSFYLATSVLVFIICNQDAILYLTYLVLRLLLMRIFPISMTLIQVLIQFPPCLTLNNHNNRVKSFLVNLHR